MEYTVQQLANLAGVSGRTLRYYDQINLLKPAHINEVGYRIYGTKEVDRLQQILFYRKLGVSLQKIKGILDGPDFNDTEALLDHKKQLLAKRQQIDVLIENVEQTIATRKGERTMTDQQKFVGFKRDLVRQNERQYGSELREKYGSEVIDASHEKFLDLSKEEYDSGEELAKEIIRSLVKAVDNVRPQDPEGQRIADLHRQWLSFYWPKYDKMAHMGLAEMYVADERFTSYYDQYKTGAAQFLRDAIIAYAKK